MTTDRRRTLLPNTRKRRDIDARGNRSKRREDGGVVMRMRDVKDIKANPRVRMYVREEEREYEIHKR